MTASFENGEARDFGRRGFKWRALTPSQAQAIARARTAGVPVDQLAREYGVSTRTVQRAAAYGRAEYTVVRVAGWRAEFVVTHVGPMRMTPWYADPEAAA